jgi:hypothetical protein
MLIFKSKFFFIWDTHIVKSYEGKQVNDNLVRIVVTSRIGEGIFLRHTGLKDYILFRKQAHGC